MDDVLGLRPGDQVAVDAVRSSSRRARGRRVPPHRRGRARGQGAGDPVLSGSFVVAGDGVIRATRVGDAAYATSLEADARRFSLIRSELQEGTNHILRLVTWVMVPVGSGPGVEPAAPQSTRRFADALRGSVAGVAAMVPEGLVLLTSIAFAAGALRLARRRVLVQELSAIEGLARVDVLCIDKTGTLTAPGMQLESIECLSDLSIESVDEVNRGDCRFRPGAERLDRRSRVREATADGLACRRPRSLLLDRKWSAVAFVDRGTWILGAPAVIGDGVVAWCAGLTGEHPALGERVLLLATRPDRAATALPRVSADRLSCWPSSCARTRRLRFGTCSTRASRSRCCQATPRRPCLGWPVVSGIHVGGGAVDASTLDDGTHTLGAARDDACLRPGPAGPEAGRGPSPAGPGSRRRHGGRRRQRRPALKQADLGIAMGSGSQSSRCVARVVLLDSSFSSVPHICARVGVSSPTSSESPISLSPRRCMRHSSRSSSRPARCLPVLPPASHHREHAHDRDPRLLPGPGP